MEKKEHPKQLRIEPELFSKAKKKAKSLGLNFSAYVRYLISKDTGNGDALT